MSTRVALLVLVGALLCAGAFALGRADAPAAATAEPAVEQAHPREEPAAAEPHSGMLPPNHPPVSGGGSPVPASPARGPDDDGATLTWRAPAAWPALPNPNAMRIATYRVPSPGRPTEDAELVVARAGGTPEANIQRWLGQFDEAGAETRTEKTVRGLKVTIVEVSGTYTAGAMMAGAPGATTSHPGWTLLGAIVETAGLPYFFKLVGPKVTVAAARAPFEALVESIAPAP